MQVWTSHKGSKAKLIVREQDRPGIEDLAFAHGLDPSSLVILTDDKSVMQGGKDLNLDALI
jgi:hypothetical protein